MYRRHFFFLYYIFLYAPITLDEFHLYGLRQADKNGKQAKNSKWNL